MFTVYIYYIANKLETGYQQQGVAQSDDKMTMQFQKMMEEKHQQVASNREPTATYNNHSHSNQGEHAGHTTGHQRESDNKSTMRTGKELLCMLHTSTFLSGVGYPDSPPNVSPTRDLMGARPEKGNSHTIV